MAEWADDLEWVRWKTLFRTEAAAEIVLEWLRKGRSVDRARFQRWFRHWSSLPLYVHKEIVKEVDDCIGLAERWSPWRGRPYGHEDAAGVGALLFHDTRWLPSAIRTSETWHQVYAWITALGALVALVMGPLSLYWSVDRVRKTLGIPWRMARSVLRTMWSIFDVRYRLLGVGVVLGYGLLTGVSTWQQVQTCRQWWHVACHVHECVGAMTELEHRLDRFWRSHPVLQWQRPTWSERCPETPLWNWGRGLCRYHALRQGCPSDEPWRRALGQVEAYVRLAQMVTADMVAGRPWSPVEWLPRDHPTACAGEDLHLSIVAPEVGHMTWEGHAGGRIVAVTGPNGSGKTMCLMALGWALLWGRALGWAPGRKVRMARWEKLCTSLRHATDVGRASLFQAELNVHQEIVNRVAPGTWILLDEPFHSTDRDGAQECGRWLLEQYTSKGGRVVLTTHERGLLAPTPALRCYQTTRPPFALRPGVWTGSVAWEELLGRFPEAVRNGPIPGSVARSQNSTAI